MAGVIASIPKFQFSANGAPMVGGTLETYVAGSTTPATTWQDSALTIANTNPITLDARGECVLWLDPAVVYKFVLKNSAGVIQWTQDNISNAAALANTLRTDLAASSGSTIVGYGASTVEATLDAHAASLVANGVTLAAHSTKIAASTNNVMGTNLDPMTVDLHYNALRGTGWISTEPGGTVSTTTTADYPAGNILAMAVASSASFRQGQLACYLGTDGTYHSFVVELIAGNTLRPASELTGAIALGAEVYNFYDNDAHPNSFGYKAIVDSAIRQLTQRKRLAYQSSDNGIWTAVGAATVTSSAVVSYVTPGTATVGERPALVSTLDFNQGARSEYVALAAGAYRANLILTAGYRSGGFSGAVVVSIDEMLASGVVQTIATKTITGYGGILSVDLDYVIRQNSAVSVSVTTPNGGASSWYIGKLAHCAVTESLASLDHGKHVLLGDSWFASGLLMARLSERLPNATFVNKGVSGNKASDLIARFSADVTPQAPEFVWVVVGTNDYYASVSVADFEQQVNQLRGLIQASGAQPVLFDASVGSVTYTPEQLTQSRSYAMQVGYQPQAVQADWVGSRQRSANIFSGPITIAAGASVVVGAIPGQTLLPAHLRNLYSSAAGLSIKIGYAGIIDTTVLVDQLSFSSATMFKDALLPRTDTQARFVLVVVNNPTGAPILTSLVADIAWIAA